jgi:hypothetical protein
MYRSKQQLSASLSSRSIEEVEEEIRQRLKSINIGSKGNSAGGEV